MQTRFFMPNDNATFGRYYSLDLGPLHLVMTNTESVLDTPDIDADQKAWLEKDLAGVDKAQTPWTLVGGHRPMYCTDKGNSEQCGSFASTLRGLVESTFLAAGVDVVVAAHEHGYERTYRVANGAVTSTSYEGAGAPVYIVNGAAGNREGNEKPAGNQPWSAFQDGSVGYSVLTVTGAPAGAAVLRWQHFASAGAVLLDSWNITK